MLVVLLAGIVSPFRFISPCFLYQLIGRPYMPAYWALGFQLCRYGYNTMENLTAAVDRTIAAGIPYVSLFASDVTVIFR